MTWQHSQFDKPSNIILLRSVALHFGTRQPDWLAYIFYLFLTGLAGAFGAFVRQINDPIKQWPQRIIEWFSGALCAIYSAELVAQIIYHVMKKIDLTHVDYVVPEKIIGLAGFLCGALGISAIDSLVIYLKNRFCKQNNT